MYLQPLLMDFDKGLGSLGGIPLVDLGSSLDVGGLLGCFSRAWQSSLL